MRGTPFGRYELLRKIAAGGMAEIFLARQWGDGGFFRDVVVKRLFPHLVEHPRALKMFKLEARLLSELRHPNVPQVTDLGCAEGTWYIAMEHVEGHNVADLWRAGARQGHVMPMPVALGIVMQTCEALHHAHERCDRAGRHLRIVHRDVTPQNVMITRDGVVKLMDFGVAQTAARRDTEAGTVKGTFSYMAPEQVRGRPVDRRADVFALGVILYELTTGSRLYRGSDVQVMTSVVEQDAPPPSSRVPSYPPELESLVMWTLQRDRDQRIPSAAELAHRLEAFAQRHGVLVGPRTVADYVSQVIPAEPVQEEELALVEPRPRLELAPEADDPEERDRADDPDLVDDLEMLGQPLFEENAEDAPTDPSGKRAELEEDLDTLAPPPLPAAGEPNADVPNAPPRPPPPPGFAAAPRPGPDAPDPDSPHHKDYVRELERRLEGDGEG